MGKPAARLGDMTAHGGPLQPGPGSLNVFIGGKPAWRANSDSHICPLATPNPHAAGVVNMGSSTVFINGFPATRIGDTVIEATGGPDPVATGEPTVLIGGLPGMELPTMPAARPLKKSFVIVALIFLFIGFGIEYGGPKLPFFQKLLPTPQQMIREANKSIDEKMDEQKRPQDDPERLKAKEEARKKITESKPKPPGFGLEADGLYLWIVFFSILISLIGMLITKATVQRAGMIASLINSVIVILMSILLIVKAIVKLVIMIVLLLALPFGPLIYLAIYGTFAKGVVLATGGLGLLCKIVAAILLSIGASQVVKVKSAALLLLTGFVTFFIIEFVLGFVPSPFASIADAIIGIIIAIIVILWSIFILIGSIRGVFS